MNVIKNKCFHQKVDSSKHYTNPQRSVLVIAVLAVANINVCYYSFYVP